MELFRFLSAVIVLLFVLYLWLFALPIFTLTFMGY